MFFLSIQFQDQIKKKPHNHYDYESPWCFPIEFQETDTIQKEWEAERNKLDRKDKSTFRESRPTMVTLDSLQNTSRGKPQMATLDSTVGETSRDSRRKTLRRKYHSFKK